MFKLPGFALAASCGMSAYFAYEWFQPTLSPHLGKDYELSITQIGYIFCIFPVFYVFSSFAVGNIPKSVSLHLQNVVGLILVGLATYMIGPSQIFFTDNVRMLMAGLAVLGLVSPLALVPPLPAMIMEV